ncbi:MAG: protein kinase [Blastocatellia bacterium]
MDLRNNLETIQFIFLEAIKLPTQEREEFIEKSSYNNQAIKKEVLELLLHHQEKDSLLDKPIFEQGINLLQQQSNPKIEHIGFYKLVKELGRGGMATVYLAERNDEQYQQKVAIKLIQPALVTETLTKMFVSERQIMANLNHNNIAKLLDGGMTDYGSPYLVMEYIDGLPIDNFCNSLKMSVIDRIKLFSKVCLAVQYAHQNLVVHRDIKPNNILVTSDGTPKLLDFGVAKLVNHTNFLSTYTQPQNRFLTPIYASPEQISGQPITTTTDVYSLGVLLYELITGHLPYKFSQTSPDEIKRVICEVEPIKPSQIVFSTQENFFLNSTLETPRRLSKIIKGDLETIILKALSKEPSRRYSSVERLVEDLNFYLTGLPIKARKESLTYSLSKFVKRNKLQVIAATLLFLTLLSGIVATLWQAHRANLAQTRAEKRFNQVRELANSFMFDFDEKLIQLPGATPSREMLVKNALKYLDSLAEEAGEDLLLQQELATAYQKVGDIQGNPKLDNLGHPEQALESYLKALKIQENILEKDNNNSKNLYPLSVSYSRIGELFLMTRKSSEALNYLIKASNLQESLSQNGHENASKTLLPTYIRLIEALDLTNKNSESTQICEKLIPLAEQLSVNYSTDLSVKTDLALAYIAMGSKKLNTDNTEKALEYYQLSLKLYEELFQKQPNNVKIQTGLSTAHEQVGSYFSQQGNPKEAMFHQNRVLEIRKNLAEKDPSNVRMQYNLFVTYFNNAEVHAVSGNPNKALEAFLHALSLIEKIAHNNPNNKFYESLGYTHIVVGEICIGLNKKDEVVKHLKKAIEILDKLYNDDPDNPQVAAELSRALRSYANFIVKTNPSETYQSNLRVLNIQKKLADKPTALIKELAEYVKTLLYAEPASLRDPATALSYSEKAAQMSQKKDPSILQTLAYNYFLLGKYPEAVQISQDALSLIPKTGDSYLRQQLQLDLKKYLNKIKKQN